MPASLTFFVHVFSCNFLPALLSGCTLPHLFICSYTFMSTHLVSCLLSQRDVIPQLALFVTIRTLPVCSLDEMSSRPPLLFVFICDGTHSSCLLSRPQTFSSACCLGSMYALQHALFRPALLTGCHFLDLLSCSYSYETARPLPVSSLDPMPSDCLIHIYT